MFSSRVWHFRPARRVSHLASLGPTCRQVTCLYKLGWKDAAQSLRDLALAQHPDSDALQTLNDQTAVRTRAEPAPQQRPSLSKTSDTGTVGKEEASTSDASEDGLITSERLVRRIDSGASRARAVHLSPSRHSLRNFCIIGAVCPLLLLRLCKAVE